MATLFTVGHGTRTTAEPIGALREAAVDVLVADRRLMSSFVDVYMKLWHASKPTLVGVQR